MIAFSCATVRAGIAGWLLDMTGLVIAYSKYFLVVISKNSNIFFGLDLDRRYHIYFKYEGFYYFINTVCVLEHTQEIVYFMATGLVGAGGVDGDVELDCERSKLVLEDTAVSQPIDVGKMGKSVAEQLDAEYELSDSVEKVLLASKCPATVEDDEVWCESCLAYNDSPAIEDMGYMLCPQIFSRQPAFSLSSFSHL